ncbi:hypothetical protein [Pseudomonas sp. RIT-PI-AD]|uniref:hypothetical protein n=1 Tax=Pseudomonas sp. RIT-PI-AD TaxID=3035294 RepID=UPI0021D8E648|nr:hypothetical protein [Pseudomonas sp. RIT-PI-AD]
MKRHGPSLNIERRELVMCRPCSGRGVVRSLFYQMPCLECHGSGQVAADGEPLDPVDLIIQLRMQLAAARTQIQKLQAPRVISGPGADYVGQTNNHHRGGGNWTGD